MNQEQHMERHYEHIKEHWKVTLVGSAVGFAAIMAELFYHIIIDQLSAFVGENLFETAVNVIVLVIFLWFLHLGIVEYEDIKHEIAQGKA